MISASSSNNDYLEPSTRSDDDDDDDNNDCGVKHGLPPKTRYSIEQPNKTNIKKAHEVLEGIRRLTIIEEPSSEHEDMARKLYNGMKFSKKGLIKNRTYHLKTYKQCFIASDAVDFMIETKMATSREEAVVIGQLLDTKLELWHHVCDDHDFQDEYLFFRFEQDDDENENENNGDDNNDNANDESSTKNFFTISKRRHKRNIRRSKIEEANFPNNNKSLSSNSDDSNTNNTNVYDEYLLLQISTKLKNDIKIDDRIYHFKTYKSCFIASDVIDYLIINDICKSRLDAIQLCLTLQQKLNLWSHVTDPNKQFNDEYLFFRFN